MIGHLWLPVVCARAKIVDYWKFRIEHGDVFAEVTEEQYVNCRAIRKRINSELGKGNWRATRRKMDAWTLGLYLLVWAMLVCATITGAR